MRTTNPSQAWIGPPISGPGKHNPDWAEVTPDQLILKANPNGGSDVVRNGSGKKRQSGEQPYMLELR